jgi:hypothetical protein
MSTGETGIRSIAARVIADYQGAVVLRRRNQGYEFTGLKQKTIVFCKTWPEAERVLIRMKVPSSKIKAAMELLAKNSDVIFRGYAPPPEPSSHDWLSFDGR